MSGHEFFNMKLERGNRRFYECTVRNDINERIEVELMRCELDYDHKWATGYIWRKAGRIDGTLDCYWHVDTYVYNEKGECYGTYNPFEMTLCGKPERSSLAPGGYRVPVRPVIDFDWLLDATDESADVILDEIYRRFIEKEPRHISPESYVA